MLKDRLRHLAEKLSRLTRCREPHVRTVGLGQPRLPPICPKCGKPVLTLRFQIVQGVGPDGLPYTPKETQGSLPN